ncbi:MAG TPA: DUF4149 domain-containing protein [Abditibacteriaceae bacterium]|nr:DUF4149 domain-containing protein [Abditibacteriaceae bacterium]
MRIYGTIFLNWLHQVALAVWLGGIVTIGGAVAPAIFGSARKAGHTAHGMPLFDFAGTAIGEAFRRFNTGVLIAGLVMLLAGVAYSRLAGLCPIRTRVRAAMTLLCWAIAVWLEYSLFPRMNAFRSQEQMDAFDDLHQTSTVAFQSQMVLLLGIVALTGWMHLDRSRHGGGREDHAPV